MHQLLHAGMADADAHAAKIIADMLVKRADAIVAARASAGLDPDLSRRKVDLVVENGEGGRRQLVKAQSLSDRLAGQVHEGLRLDQEDLFAVDHAVGDEALEFLRPGGEAM